MQPNSSNVIRKLGGPRAPGSVQVSKMTTEAQRIIEEQMQRDDKTTGKELQKLLSQNGISVASSTAVMIRWQRELGWTFKGTSYCLIKRDGNKKKRLERARKKQGHVI